MFGSLNIDVIISLCMFFFMLSLAVTGITGALLKRRHSKERNMGEGLRDLFRYGDSQHPSDQGVAERLFAHPLTAPMLAREGKQWLAYVDLPAPVLRAVLPDVMCRDFVPARTSWKKRKDELLTHYEQRWKEAQAGPPEERPAHRSHGYQLLAALSALEDGGDCTMALDDWFRESKEAIKRRYATIARTRSGLVALAIILAINADALRMYEVLSTNTTTRAALVEAAGTVTSSSASAGASSEAGELDTAAPKTNPDGAGGEAGVPVSLDQVLAATQQHAELGLPLGWKGDVPTGGWGLGMPTFWWFVSKLVGLVISVIGASLGASFWFDLVKALLPYRRLARSTSDQDAGQKPMSTPDRDNPAAENV